MGGYLSLHWQSRYARLHPQSWARPITSFRSLRDSGPVAYQGVRGVDRKIGPSAPTATLSSIRTPPID